MKIIITGSLGNISKPLATQLAAAGHQVTVISSNKNKTTDIEQIGATAAIGSLEDTDFLTQTFTGADVVYTMVPPNYSTADYIEYISGIGKNYASAIKASGVKKVVNLSSIGAHLPAGTGPIKGSYNTEQTLNKLDRVIVKHLRPASFYYNFFNSIDMIKHGGIIGGNYPADSRLVLVHPADIADAAAEEIQQPFTANTVRYIASDEKTAGQVAAILGEAIGKPNLPWVQFTNEQSIGGMKQAGLSDDMAQNLTEMGTATLSGILWEDYDQHKPTLSKHKFEAFAQEFAARFNA